MPGTRQNVILSLRETPTSFRNDLEIPRKLGMTVITEGFGWICSLDFTLSGCLSGSMFWNMVNWNQCSGVERVPVRALFQNLEGGASVDQFLEWFPGVSREQVVTVLEFARTSLVRVTA